MEESINQINVKLGQHVQCNYVKQWRSSAPKSGGHKLFFPKSEKQKKKKPENFYTELGKNQAIPGISRHVELHIPVLPQQEGRWYLCNYA